MLLKDNRKSAKKGITIYLRLDNVHNAIVKLSSVEFGELSQILHFFFENEERIL